MAVDRLSFRPPSLLSSGKCDLVLLSNRTVRGEKIQHSRCDSNHLRAPWKVLYLPCSILGVWERFAPKADAQTNVQPFLTDLRAGNEASRQAGDLMLTLFAATMEAA